MKKPILPKKLIKYINIIEFNIVVKVGLEPTRACCSLPLKSSAATNYAI